MARSSKSDPLEKFRFRITAIAIDLSITGLVDTGSALIGGGNALQLITRAGFSEAQLPKANINTMTYRENIDNQRFQKNPGLVKYEPVTLRRGVTENRDLYDWYRLVNEEIALLSVAQELTRDARIAPVQSENFRKDIIIEVLDRSGEPVKAWYLFNAFPIGYKGGDKLDAADDQSKLVEEVTLDYEMFIELEGGIEGFAKEMAKGALIGAAGAGLGLLEDATGFPFTR